MARDDEDFEEEAPRRKKKGGSKGSFWNMQRIAFVAIFVAGLILGYYIATQIGAIDFGAGDTASLQKINQELDSLNDKYYSCLQTFQIDPNTCTK